MVYPTRKLGNDEVSAIGFGAMGLSAWYGKVDCDEERFKILDAVYESGSRFWDTADVYGDSEDLIGKWFKRTGKRNEIFLATKFGARPDIPRGADGRREYVNESIAKSLSRLGVDSVDLFYQHRVDLEIPIEETVGAMAELVKTGKVRYLGLSECSADTLRRASAVHPIAALQVEYSPFMLEIEDPKIGILKTCRELGIKIIPYSPLGRGLLTGQYKSLDDFEDDDFRRTIPKFSGDNFPRILKLAGGLKAIGARHGATAGQVALAWILAQGDDFIPIPGTRKLKYLEENTAAIHVELSPEELQEVRKIAEEADTNHGDRYASMRHIFGDSAPLTAICVKASSRL